jgi:hypothetical protein
MTPREELEALRRLAELEARERVPAPKPERAPVEDPGFAQSMLIGTGRTFDRIGKGVQQMYYGATGQDGKQAALKAEADADDAAYKPLQDLRPWATGIGEALPSVALPAGGATTILGNMGRMALAGAAPGALEYGTVGERAKRAAVGAASGAAVPAVVLAAKTGKALVEPLYEGGRKTIAGRTMNRAAGGMAPEVARKMSAASELVPGSAPTAAEVAESGGIAALQRAAAAANPEPFTNRAMDQASARMSALRGIAKDDTAMEAAKAARDAASKPLYGQADSAVVPLDGYFSGLMQRKQFKSAVDRANELAEDAGISGGIFFRGNDGKPVAMLGEGAHFIKKALDEAAERGSTSYTGQAGAKNAGNTQTAFLNWLDKSVPEYRQASEAFAEASRPINQMEIGRELLDRVSPALSDFGALGKESGAQFARAMRNADQTAAKATGFSGARLADVMTPRQMQTLNSIGKDLARKTNAQDLGRGPGSNTFQNLAMQNIAEQSGMPRAVGGLLSLPGVSRATNWLYRDTDEKVQGLLADALLEPKKGAGLMTSAGKRTLANNPKTRKLLEQAAMRSAALGLLSYAPE